LRTVLEKFRKARTSQLVDVSHNEPAWKANIDQKKLISYNYAFDLQAL